jgi:hypothetical protein
VRHVLYEKQRAFVMIQFDTEVICADAAQGLHGHKCYHKIWKPEMKSEEEKMELYRKHEFSIDKEFP